MNTVSGQIWKFGTVGSQIDYGRSFAYDLAGGEAAVQTSLYTITSGSS